MRRRRIGHFAYKTQPVLPSRVRSKNGDVVDGKQLTSRVHSLWKAGHLADCERNYRRIALIIILAGKTVLRTEDVIDIAVDLVGVEGARWAFHERIKRLIAGFSGSCV